MLLPPPAKKFLMQLNTEQEVQLPKSLIVEFSLLLQKAFLLQLNTEYGVRLPKSLTVELVCLLLFNASRHRTSSQALGVEACRSMAVTPLTPRDSRYKIQEQGFRCSWG